MSFAEKLGTLMKRPNDDLVSKDEIPWYLKYSGRGLGTIGGGAAMILGLLNLVFSLVSGFDCIFASIWQMIAAFSILVIEAPCCCIFVDYVQDASNWADSRPFWNRAAFYLLISIPPLYLCLSVNTFLGSGLIFATGILYGMMALGKKASHDEMRNNASTIYGNHTQQFPPSTLHSNLVDSSQPVSMTNPFDSGV